MQLASVTRRLGALSSSSPRSRPVVLASAFLCFCAALRPARAAAFVLRTARRRSFATVKMSEGAGEEKKTLRVLALHGSSGSAASFAKTLEPIRRAIEERGRGDHRLEITALDGPFDKDEGYCWWNMPPGVRSFNAEEYEGFEESEARVLEAWKNANPRFDYILGHSQGGILLGALLALQREPYHPSGGYILNGVAWPNPYREELSGFKLHANANDAPPRILVVTGTDDRITPNSSGDRLRDALDEAGGRVSTISHGGGHGVPVADEESVGKLIKWMLEE